MSSSNGSMSASSLNGTDRGGYSSKVRLFLRLMSGDGDAENIPLAQVGGERLYFDAPILLPAGLAQVIVEIDGEPVAKSVMLPESTGPARVISYLTVD